MRSALVISLMLLSSQFLQGQDAVPPRIAQILKAIPAIKKGEMRDAVFKRLGLYEEERMHCLLGQGSLGQWDNLWAFRPDGRWILEENYEYNAEGHGKLLDFRIYWRPAPKDIDELDYKVLKPLYPYLEDGKVIRKAPKKQAEQGADPNRDGAPSD